MPLVTSVVCRGAWCSPTKGCPYTDRHLSAAWVSPPHCRHSSPPQGNIHKQDDVEAFASPLASRGAPPSRQTTTGTSGTPICGQSVARSLCWPTRMQNCLWLSPGCRCPNQQSVSAAGRYFQYAVPHQGLLSCYLQTQTADGLPKRWKIDFVPATRHRSTTIHPLSVEIIVSREWFSPLDAPQRER